MSVDTEIDPFFDEFGGYLSQADIVDGLLIDVNFWFRCADDAAERGYMQIADLYWDYAQQAQRVLDDRKLMKEKHYA